LVHGTAVAASWCVISLRTPAIAAVAALAPALAGAQPASETIGSVEPRAVADSQASDPAADSAPSNPGVVAPDLGAAPLPGSESGRVDPIDAGDSTLRRIGRGLLFLPRVTLGIVLAPVRAGVWANEEYHLYDRAYDVFFNDDGTMGLYPTVRLESGFGLNVGARFVHRDLFGAREHLGVFAGTGGRFRQITSASLRTGDRLGKRFALEVEGEYEQRPKDAFYGIGNGDPGVAQPRPVDPRIDVTAIEARHRQRLARVAGVASVRVASALQLRAAGALTDLEFERSDSGVPIDEMYLPAGLVGFGGVRHAYTELELRWDSRRPASVWDSEASRGTGWFASVYAGRVTRLDAGPDFWRTGADVQRFWRLDQGPRVLVTRLYGEAVTGTRDEVPFTELPMLGGNTLLRGYPIDRFRDRIAGLASAEYQWDLTRNISGVVFLDAGRVFAAPGELTIEDLRVGYGVGIEARTRRSFLMRASLATSVDGGVFANLAFDPVFDLDKRVERR
jgi:hypothetical protein